MPTPSRSDQRKQWVGDELLVDAREAARLLSVSERTLWGLTNRGELRSVRIGRVVRYRRRDIEDYIASKTS